MNPRIRPIKNLYFRWGRELDLEPLECAGILEDAGLIEIEGAYYRETPKALEIPEDRYDYTIKDTLIFAILEKNNGNK